MHPDEIPDNCRKKYRAGNAVKLFPITFFQTRVPNNDEIKEILVPKLLEDSKELAPPKGWLTNKLKTSFDGEKPGKEVFFGKDDTYQTILEQKYAYCIDSIFDAHYRIAIDEIWYNVYQENEWQETHDHLGMGGDGPQFSCIHFLSFDPNRHEPPTFKDPMHQLRSLSLELARNKYEEIWVPDISEGDLIVFPSYLQHAVPPGPATKDYPRISIAFNFKVLSYAVPLEEDNND